jgi:hypothetical protein
MLRPLALIDLIVALFLRLLTLLTLMAAEFSGFD